MTRGSLARWAFAAVITVCLSGSCSTDDGDESPSTGRRTDGPLRMVPEGGYSHSLPVGAEFTDGFWVLRLDGDEPATIDDVRIEASNGLEQLGVMLAAPARPIASVQVDESWPPRHRYLPKRVLVDAIGAEITPARDGWELLIGMKAAARGYLQRDGVTVDYTVGDKAYTAYLPISVFICTDKKYEEDGVCPTPKGF